MHDSMHRNSSLLIISQAVLGLCGLLFWIIIAHLFSSHLVGLATSFISLGLLAATFTNLGLPNLVIRFLNTSYSRGGLFSASLLLVMVSSLLGGVIALCVAEYVLSDLRFIDSSAELSLLMILLISTTTVSALLDGTLVAFGKAEYILRKSMLINIPRLILPFFVLTAGLRGMIGLYVLSILIGITYNLFIIKRWLLQGESFRPTLAEIGRHRSYAASNYFGGMFAVLPSTLAPIMVLSMLGASKAAYWYMPMTIVSFLSVVCASISQALISECSRANDTAVHRAFFMRALKRQYELLIPAVLLLCGVGWPILRVYGPAYARNGYLPLVVLCTSSLFVGINWLGDTWLNIRRRSRDYFLMNALNAVATVGFVYLFAAHGLVAAALGWLCGQLLAAAVYLAVFARDQLPMLPRRLKTP
jgi:O-antigen/teichoic acid export membrane protein